MKNREETLQYQKDYRLNHLEYFRNYQRLYRLPLVKNIVCGVCGLIFLNRIEVKKHKVKDHSY